MRKHKVLLISLLVGLCLLLAGGVCVGIGLANNGQAQISIYHKKMFDGNLSLIGVKHSNTKNYKQQEFKPSSLVDTLTINGNISDIKFVEGSELKIVANIDDTKKIETKEIDNEYTIDIIQEESLIFAEDGSDIHCYIPSAIKHINVTSNVGDIELENISVDSLNINNDAGDISLDNVTVNNANLETNAGDIEFDGDILSELKVNSNIGDIDLSLNRSRDHYNYDLSVDVGDVNKGNTHHNDNAATISGSTNIGDIEIEFKD